MHFIYIKSEPILCPPMLRNQRPKALCWMRHVARKPSSSRLSSQSCAKAMVWTSPLKVARFTQNISQNLHGRSAWKICKHYDDYGILWIYDDLYDDIDASDFLNGLEELPKRCFKEISSHIGVCLKIGYPKKSSGWISHRNPHYIQTECLVYNLLHITYIYIYVYVYVHI